MNIAMLNNLFGPDMLIIFLVILLLFGAKKLPELAKGMGQAVREFSKAKDDIEREVTRPPETEQPKQIEEPKATAATADPGHESHIAHEAGTTKPEPAKDTQPQETSSHVG